MADDKGVDLPSPSETITWWVRNKNKVYGVILVLVGLLGGNVDRIPEIVSDILPTEVVLPAEAEQRIEANEGAIEALENNQRILRETLDELTVEVENMKSSLNSSKSSGIIPIK